MGLHLGISNPSHPLLTTLATSNELTRFLNDLTCLVLIVASQKTPSSSTPSLIVSNSLDDIDATKLANYSKTIILGKTKPAHITDENLSDIVTITPLKRDPVDALYQSLHGVFGPLLLR